MVDLNKILTVALSTPPFTPTPKTSSSTAFAAASASLLAISSAAFSAFRAFAARSSSSKSAMLVQENWRLRWSMGGACVWVWWGVCRGEGGW